MASNDTIKELKKKYDELNEQLESANLMVKILQSQKDRLPTEIQKENEELRLKNSMLLKNIDLARNKIDNFREDKKELGLSLDNIKKENYDLKKKYDTLREDNKALYSSQVETEKTNDDLKKKYDTLKLKYNTLYDQFQSSMQDSWHSNLQLLRR